ncbi:MAG: glucose-1-phosphate adenylyltransferase subunit GlgD, partial [Clostridia bacterium]|nr:glucose-1-phosphate adenylyltransferase subunit GlgD [Clostridia bacterium]
MKAKNVLGLIFPNTHDECMSEMTSVRALGSLPFAGGYRVIDFMLSSMVDGGIQKVGIVTKSNYQSLMDHLGNGKPWELSRKYEGLFMLPPYNTDFAGVYSGKISALRNIGKFIRMSREDYVAMSDCHVVYSLDYGELLEKHLASGADVTFVAVNGKTPAFDNILLFSDVDENGRVGSVRLNSAPGEEALFSTGVILMSKALLLRLINDAAARGDRSFERDVIVKNASSLKLYVSVMDTFAPVIDSLAAYFSANMSMLDTKNRADLLGPRPIYTKVRDDIP